MQQPFVWGVCSVVVSHQRSEVVLAAFPRGESDVATAQQSAGVPAVEMGTPKRPSRGGEHGSGSVPPTPATKKKSFLVNFFFSLSATT